MFRNCFDQQLCRAVLAQHPQRARPKRQQQQRARDQRRGCETSRSVAPCARALAPFGEEHGAGNDTPPGQRSIVARRPKGNEMPKSRTPSWEKLKAEIGEAESGTAGRVSLQSQRDSVAQPRVARNELPWVAARKDFNPNGVAADSVPPSRVTFAATPLGLRNSPDDFPRSPGGPMGMRRQYQDLASAFRD